MEPLENQIPPVSSTAPDKTDPIFHQQVQRLHQLTVYARWVVVVSLWLSVGVFSLWGLRNEIQLWIEHFTWAALRYGLSFWYNPFPSFGLGLCVGMTLAVLIWQSRNILMGMPRQERMRLEQQVLRIRQQGSSHPLWKWVISDRPR